MMADLLVYLAPLVLLALGWAIGSYREKAHYRSIHGRQTRFVKIPCLNTKTVPRTNTVSAARLMVGSMVVSVDCFKRFLAGLRNIFGGEVRSYSPLVDRARREAILRMKEQAADADLFVNLKLETSSVSQVGSVEVLAYCTATWYGKPA